MTEDYSANSNASGIKRKPFNIGLTMAGAVSAGAYSAGVFDFLMEALNEWQAAKDRGDAGIPRHEVYISTISGASAGGITGALGLLSVASGIQPGSEPATGADTGGRRAGTRPAKSSPTSFGSPIRRCLPGLFDAWVKGPRFLPEKGIGRSAFLDTRDVEAATPIASLLDSSLLTTIAETAVDRFAPARRSYPFFTDPVHLFLTLTNLDGVPYVMPFSADGSAGHYMVNHADRVHYAVHGVGAPAFPDADCQWLARWGDSGQPLDLAQPLPVKSPQRQRFVESVLATSAFPFGLRPRQIAMPARDYQTRAWPIEETYRNNQARPIMPAWPSTPGWSGATQTHFVAVDGGATDNQPFELARWTIRNLDLQENPRGSREADRAVVMVDPFGQGQPFDVSRIQGDRKKDLVLSYVLKSLLPALTNQARFKMTDLVQANDEHTYSRFLVSPIRSAGTDPQGRHVSARPSLASESLYAFSGFIDQRFREHDFQLGRRNCQNFLRRHFVLHKSNPVFCDVMRADDIDPYYVQAGSDFGAQPGGQEMDDYRPIIPLTGSARVECASPVWPRIEENRLDLLERAIRTRLDMLAISAINATIGYPLWNMAARWIWRRFKREEIVGIIRQTIESSLYKGGQIMAPGGDKRAPSAVPTATDIVLGALADPSWDFRTVAGIRDQLAAECSAGGADSKPLDEREIATALSELSGRTYAAPSRPGRPLAFTLRHRKPWLRNGLTRWLANPNRWVYDDRHERSKP